MKFAYRRYDTPVRSPLDGETEVFRPEIPVRLIGSLSDVFVLGLLDTGSDSVVMGRGIAERIGARLRRRPRWKVHGFGGQSLEAVRGMIEIEIVHRGESLCWPLPIAVVTHDDPDQNEVLLLGQSGFLQFFDVRFFGEEHLVELKPNAKFPRKPIRTDH